MFLLLNLIFFFFKSVNSSFTAAKQAGARCRRGTKEQLARSAWLFQSDQFLQMELQGTKDNTVHKQSPCAKSVSCKHNLPPDQCTTVWRQTHTHTHTSGLRSLLHRLTSISCRLITPTLTSEPGVSLFSFGDAAFVPNWTKHPQLTGL